MDVEALKIFILGFMTQGDGVKPVRFFHFLIS